MTRHSGIFAAAVGLTFWCCTAPAAAAGFLLGAGTHVGQGRQYVGPVLERVERLGFRSVRDELYWARFEKARGSYGGDVTAERVVDLFEGVSRRPNGRPLVVLDYGNRLYGGGLPLSPQAVEGFAAYAEAVARRLAGSRPILEIWNEWNGGMGAHPPAAGRAEDYARLAVAAARRIRAVAPDATVLMGATAGYDGKWTDSLLATGALRHADGFSVHPYSFRHASDRSPEQAIRWLDLLDGKLRRWAGAVALPPPPVYVTEIGWPVSGKAADGISEARQAAFAERFLLLARARDYVRGVWWYELADGGRDARKVEHVFGLLRPDGSPRAAAAVIARWSACMHGGAGFEARAVTPSVHQVSGSCRPGHRFLALWSSAPGGTRLSVDGLAGSWYRGLDGGGRIDTPGPLSLRVGESPVVLASDAAADWPRVAVVE
ncbi:MAG: cellulase family glycosylhydrolase [Rhodocyclaceae bacterium]|nr:cellulase family glycosylhydrolase [Rhodocyclaceae bacterium]